MGQGSATYGFVLTLDGCKGEGVKHQGNDTTFLSNRGRPLPCQKCTAVDTLRERDLELALIRQGDRRRSFLVESANVICFPSGPGCPKMQLGTVGRQSLASSNSLGRPRSDASEDWSGNAYSSRRFRQT